MLKPLRRRAKSVAVAGRASKAIPSAQKSAAALAVILAAVSVANVLFRIIFFDWSQAKSSQADTNRSVNLVNHYRFERLPVEHVLNGCGYAALRVRARQRPAPPAQLFR